MIVAKVTLGLLLGRSSHHKAPWAITVHLQASGGGSFYRFMSEITVLSHDMSTEEDLWGSFRFSR